MKGKRKEGIVKKIEGRRKEMKQLGRNVLELRERKKLEMK